MICFHWNKDIKAYQSIFSSPERSSGRGIALPAESASALESALAKCYSFKFYLIYVENLLILFYSYREST